MNRILQGVLWVLTRHGTAIQALLGASVVILGATYLGMSRGEIWGLAAFGGMMTIAADIDSARNTPG